jgi:hypothetical protein
MSEAAVVLDGELVSMDAEGPVVGAAAAPDACRRSGRDPPAPQSFPFRYMIFAVLHAGGQSLLRRPPADRRTELNQLYLEGSAWQTPPSWIGGGLARLPGEPCSSQLSLAPDTQGAAAPPGATSAFFVERARAPAGEGDGIDASAGEFLEAAGERPPAEVGLRFPLLLDPAADVIADLELYERAQRRPGVVHVRKVAPRGGAQCTTTVAS